MSAALRKFLAPLFLSLSLLILPMAVSAQTADMVDGQPLSSENYNSRVHSAYSFQGLIHSGFCELAHHSPAGECPIITLEQTANGPVQKILVYKDAPSYGAIGGIGNMIASLYTPPTSTTEYVASIGNKIGIQTAHAQELEGSTGNGVIKPMLGLWEALRKIAYTFFILIMLVLGFMIMLRRKLGQVVITVQSALPRLVVGLILITFSYFISALIIDLSYILIYFAANFFGTMPNKFGDQQSLLDLATSSNILSLWNISGTVADSQMIGEINNTIGSVIPGGPILIGVVGAIIGGIIGIAGGPAGIVLGGLTGGGIVLLIIPIILLIALTVQFIRLFIQLLMAYVNLLIATATSPIIILVSVIPGREKMIDLWWKSVLGNALVFPVVFIGFLFAGMILGLERGDWTQTAPFFGGLQPTVIQIFMGYAILLALPSLPEMVRKAIGVPSMGTIPQVAMGAAMTAVGLARGTTATFTKPITDRRKAYHESGQRTLIDEYQRGTRSPSGLITWFNRGNR